MANRKENILPSGVTLDDIAYIRAIKNDGSSVRLPKSELPSGGGQSYNVVDDQPYTILDGDGYTDIIIFNMSAVQTVTIPLAANNRNREITIWHGDLAGATDYKVRCLCQGPDSFENGFDNLSVEIPLMSPGDNITFKARNTGNKWDIKNAKSSWRKAFYTYQGTWTDSASGTFIKREGFDVKMEAQAVKGGGPWAAGDSILVVNPELAPRGFVGLSFGTNNSQAAYTVLFINGVNPFDTFQIQSTNPGVANLCQTSLEWSTK